jgi:hypothetical protein
VVLQHQSPSGYAGSRRIRGDQGLNEKSQFKQGDSRSESTACLSGQNRPQDNLDSTAIHDWP